MNTRHVQITLQFELVASKLGSGTSLRSAKHEAHKLTDIKLRTDCLLLCICQTLCNYCCLSICEGAKCILLCYMHNIFMLLCCLMCMKEFDLGL